MKNNYLSKAVKIVGGQVKLAAEIRSWHAQRGNTVKVMQAHVWNWLNSYNPAPPGEHCRAIEDSTGGAVTRYDLRPDVFGTPCEANQIKAAA